MKTIFVVVAALALVACSKTDPAEAERAATEYAKKVKDSTGEVSCTQKDTDGDGYVTCTVFMVSGEDRSVECGAERFCLDCARGCKQVETVKYRERKR
jgi:hypothetical protein